MNWLKDTINMYENADIDLEKIAEELEWKSGRYIKNLVRNVHNKALKFYKKASKKSEEFIVTNELFFDSVKYTDDTQETLDKIMWFKI
jgi:SpoVK/Ycf46/Vps4 family AAA+-type ATPase